MGILNNIFSKIFPSAQAAAANVDNTVKDKVNSMTDAAKNAASGIQTETQQNSDQAKQVSQTDVMSILENLANKYPEKLNWKTSIVDLLKLLGIDNSLEARKNLAKELNYPGSTDDTASMNMWLIKEVMKKIAEKGGDVTHLFS
ncbi:hypothetical protein A9G09_10800 [Gilliamella sp. wkB292]|uniref:DUF3597 domain-containing protein n=1 Tax=unclassified Gilliamella TaxID=2685620 RepID=UPI00080DB87C|nr:DUF3597 domain-containing protein [Gilliamella apicola]OCG11416.1 hypothetical protein A9G09_10800 [Gilliamella apicola]OCL19677.1 hypothetical protein A9G03_08215 [Gilliamella apicola]